MTSPIKDYPAPAPLRLGFIIASAALMWLAFMTVHEIGHMLGAAVGGGAVHGIELRPWLLSRTEFAANPRPLLACWSGPVLGTVMPLVALALSTLLRPNRWITAFAAFCCIVNGVYIASGTIAPTGDTADLLRLGSPRWTLAAFGAPVTITGFWLLHTLGPGLGTRPDTGAFSARDTALWLTRTLAALVLLGAGMTAASMVWPA